MKTPSEIAAEAVQDELYARALFAKLIARPPAELRAAVESDPRACTEFMARHILDYVEEHHDTTAPTDAVSLAEAAQAATTDTEFHVRFRAEKELANAYRFAGRLPDAKGALVRATHAAAKTWAADVHLGNAHFGWAVWCEDARASDRASDHAKAALAYFDKAGAVDRAHTVRLFQAGALAWRGEHLAAVCSFQDAVSEAIHARSTADLGDTYLNMGVSYYELGELEAARRCYGRARHYFRKQRRFVHEARALRCVASVSIRLLGESAVGDMEMAKNAFLSLGHVGEVCRSTLDAMHALLKKDPTTDLTAYCAGLAEEAETFGMPQPVQAAIRRLASDARAGSVSEEALAEAWAVLGQAAHPWTVSQQTGKTN